MQLFRCSSLSLSLSWGSLDSEIRPLAGLLSGNFRANTYGAESFPCVQHAIPACLRRSRSMARSDLIKQKEKCNLEFAGQKRREKAYFLRRRIYIFQVLRRIVSFFEINIVHPYKNIIALIKMFFKINIFGR